MGFNQVVSAERIHIGFFGMRNAGKSSLVNAVTNQKLSVVSDVKGTTTDPVKKAMELLPLGPVVVIDTPGMDDEGELGVLRMQKTRQVLAKTDIAVLVADVRTGIGSKEEALLEEIKKRKIPYVIVYNKMDLAVEKEGAKESIPEEEICYVSALTGEGIQNLKQRLAALAPKVQQSKVIVADLLKEKDIVVLVTPIDESAPKGRLILPQQLTLREILDVHGIVITCQDTELPQTLEALSEKPKLVITDSQAFERVDRMVPEEIPLTSFSILMARYKGELSALIEGAAALSRLKEKDKVLIAEGCTHHRQCNDIGTVKMPRWIEAYAKGKPDFSFTSGGEFPEDVSEFALVVHCGGCMLNEAEMKHRIGQCQRAGVPMVNYGIAIAQMHGILKRSVELFADELPAL